jgi:hypothetical protein
MDYVLPVTVVEQGLAFAAPPQVLSATAIVFVSPAGLRSKP